MVPNWARKGLTFTRAIDIYACQPAHTSGAITNQETRRDAQTHTRTRLRTYTIRRTITGAAGGIDLDVGLSGGVGQSGSVAFDVGSERWSLGMPIRFHGGERAIFEEYQTIDDAVGLEMAYRR